MDLIKNIIERIKLWFKRKKTINKRKKHYMFYHQSSSKKKGAFNRLLPITDENPVQNIGEIYTKVSYRELNILNDKLNDIKKRLGSINDTNIDQEISNIENIAHIINKNTLYINQIENIEQLLSLTENNEELHIDTNEKINYLKDNIKTIVDKKLTSYEKKVIEKAYYDYKEVNYVIVTTIFIDDIIKDIDKLNENIKYNKGTKYDYEQAIKGITDRLDKLKKINDRPDVYKELNRLKNDFYTKQKDKYDLLYNEEIFINIKHKCEEILTSMDKENEKTIEKEKNLSEREKKLIEKEEKRKELLKVKKQKEMVQNQELKEYYDNIQKRFNDLQIAHNILLKRKKKKEQIVSPIKSLIASYAEFLVGENTFFNFERNRTKTEIVKLYNDLGTVLSVYQKNEFISLEHINIKLDVVSLRTLEMKAQAEQIIERTAKVKIVQSETSNDVDTKLTNIIEKEKKREKETNSKTLKKTPRVGDVNEK